MSATPPSSTICARCAAPLAPTAAQGRCCPRCLLEQALQESDAELDTPDGTRRPPAAPELAEIAPLFPELEIVELLGQGGMGSVYKARQRALGRWVALKILTPRPGDESDFAARFEREAQALARLAHPSVVGIHDSGRSGGRCWLLMEYVEGVNLRELLRAGELDLARVLSIVRQICEALEYAHEQGVVHRDIKPENVLVDTRGRVKIADFGLAKVVGEALGAPSLTRTQQSMGTPQYMAPEQLTGSRHVDHRADIYSLGVVFYELVTGELPLGRFEPPSRRAAVDARFDEVVLRALEREPEKRYQHATELKTRIERLGRSARGTLRSARVPSLAWTLCFWPGALVLAIATRALALARGEAELVELGYGLLVLGVLVGSAWFFRHDRRGAALRAVLGGSACVGALACLVGDQLLSAPVLGAGAAASAEPWVVRGLLALLAFEAWRLAQSGRAELAQLAPAPSARLRADAVLLVGTLLVVLACILPPTRAHAPLVAALVVLLVDLPALSSAVPSARPAPLPAPARSFARRAALPVLVAIAGWVLPLFTHGWGWLGPVASTLVLSLALALHLQRGLAPRLREELRRAPAPGRSARALSAFLLLALGALGVGAALIERAPLRGESAAEPGGERVAQLAGLVAGEAREGDDSLLALPQRIRACRLESRAEVPETEIAEGERVPSVAYGILLVLLAPVVLVWTRRYGWSWNGCWRWACEGACISACGLLGSLPIGALLVTHDSAAPGEPSTALSVAAGLPQGIEATRSSLESALAAEGYSASGRTTRMLGDAQGWALAVDRLAASAEPVLGHLATWAGPLGPREPALLIELAGDPGQRASAIRIEAPHVRGAHAEAWRGLLGRILERTRGQ